MGCANSRDSVVSPPVSPRAAQQADQHEQREHEQQQHVAAAIAAITSAAAAAQIPANQILLAKDSPSPSPSQTDAQDASSKEGSVREHTPAVVSPANSPYPGAPCESPVMVENEQEASFVDDGEEITAEPEPSAAAAAAAEDEKPEEKIEEDDQEAVLVDREPRFLRHFRQVSNPCCVQAHPKLPMLFIADVDSHSITSLESDGSRRVAWQVEGLDQEYPRALAVHGQQNLVFSVNLLHDMVQTFTCDGAFVRKFGGYPELQENGFYSVAVDEEENALYLVDASQHRVQVVDLQGKPLRTIGSVGDGDGEFRKPLGVAVSSKRDLVFVCEGGFGTHNRVQVFHRDGTFIAKFGRFGDATGQFQYPQHLAIDHKRELLFVADQGNHRVQAFSFEGQFQFAIGTEGNADGQLSSPDSVSVSEDVLYVVDRGNRRVAAFSLEAL